MRWNTAQFGDVLGRIRNGLTVSQSPEAGGLPITRIETISHGVVNPEKVGYAGIAESDRAEWYLLPGDILFSHINSEARIGNCALYEGIPFPLVHGMNLLSLTPSRSLIDSRFLLYYIRSSFFRQSVRPFIKRAVNQASISIGSLRTIEIPLPPPSEQRKIVEILDQADVLRKKRAEADKLAERILPALFYKMFGDPATNPMGLKKEELGEKIRVRSGNFLPARSMDPAGQSPVYGGNGINGYHSEYMFEDPVIVLGRVGIYCGAVHLTRPRSWVTDNALYVSEFSDDLRIGYLTEALRVANLNQYAGRAGQPLISGSRIYPTKILIPPTDDQEVFEKRLATLQDITVDRQAAGASLETLYPLLLHRAFTGDLTSKWRDKHKEKLAREMEEQVEALKQAADSTKADKSKSKGKGGRK